MSHPVSDMEALKTTQQAPSPSFCSFMPDLRGINCLDLFVGVRRGRLKCGFGTCVDPLLLVGFLAGRLPSSSAASSRIVGFGFKSLLEKWKFGGFKFDGCCPLSKFQNLRCHLVAVSFAWKNSGTKWREYHCYLRRLRVSIGLLDWWRILGVSSPLSRALLRKIR